MTINYPAAVRKLNNALTPQTLAQIGAVYAFHFPDGTSTTLDGSQNNALGYLDGPPAEHGLTSDFEITLSRDDFAKLIFGELHPMAGMATGRMKLRGSMKQAIKLDRLLKGSTP